MKFKRFNNDEKKNLKTYYVDIKPGLKGQVNKLRCS